MHVRRDPDAPFPTPHQHVLGGEPGREPGRVVGQEAHVAGALGVRLGYQSLFLQDSEVGLTGGAGFRGTLDGLRYHVDYAWADQGRLEDTHRFSFGLLF